jgi:hypothetical protein
VVEVSRFRPARDVKFSADVDIEEAAVLLSCVGFGWYEWRAMGLRKGEVCGAGGAGVLMRV